MGKVGGLFSVEGEAHLSEFGNTSFPKLYQFRNEFQNIAKSGCGEDFQSKYMN